MYVHKGAVAKGGVHRDSGKLACARGVHREFSSCCWDSLSERSGVNVIACPHDGGELVYAY